MRSEVLLRLLLAIVHSHRIIVPSRRAPPFGLVLPLEVVHNGDLLILTLQALFRPEVFGRVLDPILPRVAARRVHQSVQQLSILLVDLPLTIKQLRSIGYLDSRRRLIVAHSLVTRPGNCVQLGGTQLVSILRVQSPLFSERAQIPRLFRPEVPQLQVLRQMRLLYCRRGNHHAFMPSNTVSCERYAFVARLLGPRAEEVLVLSLY